MAGRQGVGGGLLEQQRPRSLKSLKQRASLLQLETNLRIPDVNDDAMVMMVMVMMQIVVMTIISYDS